MRYLLDTNALVYFLEDAVTGFQGIEDGVGVYFSFITRIE
jgi:predicted nucleic acid-binding protein